MPSTNVQHAGMNFSTASVLDDAINQWHRRLEACIHAVGGHFEHLLRRCMRGLMSNYCYRLLGVVVVVVGVVVVVVVAPCVGSGAVSN